MGGPQTASRGAAGRWRAHPVPAALLRALVLLLPGALALLAVVLVSRLLPAPAGEQVWPAAVRLGGLVLLAWLVAFSVDRAARRLLPLVMLLRMSMLFPGRAPSRFRLARRACSGDVQAALNPRPGDDASAVAERAVGLLAALAAHDRHTRGHSQRVQVLAEMLAREVGMGSADRQRLRWAALLHDIGKLSVSAAVLSKPDRLEQHEWEQVREHPVEGARLCGPLLDWLGGPGLAIAQHHERFDGTGYPLGLVAGQISEAGRLVCLVDAFETMTAARPYKKPLATRDARAELARCSGTHFDPVLVRAFLAIPLPRLLWASGPVSFLLQLPFLPLIQAGSRNATAALTAAGTGIVASGAAVVIVTTAAAAPATTAAPNGSAQRPATSSSASAWSSGDGTAGGSGGPADGAGPGSGGSVVGPGPSALPTGSVPSGTGGSGPSGGSTPAPSVTGLLPPLTLPTLPKVLTSTVPSAVSSAVGGLLPAASASPTSSGVTVDLPVVGGVTVKPGRLLG